MYSHNYQFWPSKAKSQLGAGSFGTAYRVKGLKDRKLYAAKSIDVPRLLREVPDMNVKKIEREAWALRALDHPNIVGMSDCFYKKERKEFCLVLEFCEGGNLLDQILKRGRIPIVTVKKWFRQMGEALQFMHEGGSGKIMLHRDMKGDNVLLDGNEDLKLTDLGLATEVAANALVSRQGCQIYASKQKLMGMRFEGDDDMWAVGCMLTEIVTHKLVGQRIGRAMAFCIMNGPIADAIRETSSLEPSLAEAARGLLKVEDAKGRWTARKLVAMMQ